MSGRVRIKYRKTTHGLVRQAFDYSDDQGRSNDIVHTLVIFGILIIW
ncbi:hypothetical protein [Mycobacteroides abscessus]